MIRKKGKLAQEEIIGFGIIVGIVFIILLVFLSIWMRKPSQGNDSYQAESFVNSVLEYTTSCQMPVKGYLSVRDLIFECYDEEECVNGSVRKSSCEILGTTLDNIAKESWLITENTEYKGYVLNITGNGRELASVRGGNKTSTYYGYKEPLFRVGVSVEIVFNLYK